MSKNYNKKKFNTELCDNTMTFEDCELTILRHAVDNTTNIQGKAAADNEDIKKMILILENFLIRKKCICYGGTAINNILPNDVQFYNREIEIPDYDFFSKNALVDAKELADIYFHEGFTDVEAKSGIHKGTYKVFVNFIPIADITELNNEIYDNLVKEAITILGIRYCPPNYLRMSMYLELSRPAGDVSRWEKVFKRLNLLNKYYPLKPNLDCKRVKEQDKEEIEPTIFSIMKNSFIEQGAVFFGGYAAHLYSNYMPKAVKRLTDKVPEFDILIENHDKCALIIKERLEDSGIKDITIVEHDAIQDIIPKHSEIKIGNQSYAFIYEPIACHNYNVLDIEKQKVNIATIDTMLSFYLAFIYLNNDYYNKDRILCLAKYLYEVEQHNRLEQSNILKRFSIKCIGKQHGLIELRAEKSEMFKKLANKHDTKEYENWFLKYVPSQMTKNEQNKRKKKVEKYLKNNEQKSVKSSTNNDSKKTMVFNTDFNSNSIQKSNNRVKSRYMEHSNIILEQNNKLDKKEGKSDFFNLLKLDRVYKAINPFRSYKQSKKSKNKSKKNPKNNSKKWKIMQKSAFNKTQRNSENSRNIFV